MCAYKEDQFLHFGRARMPGVAYNGKQKFSNNELNAHAMTNMTTAEMMHFLPMISPLDC